MALHREPDEATFPRVNLPPGQATHMPIWTIHLVNARGQFGASAAVIRRACAEAEQRMAAVAAPPCAGHCHQRRPPAARIDAGQRPLL